MLPLEETKHGHAHKRTSFFCVWFYGCIEDVCVSPFPPQSCRDIYQMMDASRTLVPLDKGATGGSASMTPDSTAPPKQKSMELNQQAKGLTLDTSRTPAQERKD